uniref:Uncharacterized protein n=1 Tax=Streptomyces sp. NBC_01393 TaxID=2903851 RepID=A0AAU3I7I8_9ACTN
MPKFEGARTVHARVPYLFDKELHVSTLETTEDGLFADLREFIPSREFYGRGVTFPIGLLDQVLAGFESVWHANGAGEFSDAVRDRLGDQAEESGN